jgi:Xaa-Pro dipeptidase
MALGAKSVRPYMISRRSLLNLAGAAVIAAPIRASAAAATTGLKSLTATLKPIALAERRTRIAKAQQLMLERKMGALLVESGPTLEYFTAVNWHRSERVTAAVIPARGNPTIVTPHFEEPSVRETLQVSAEVKTWDEHEDPFALLAGIVRAAAAPNMPLAVESTTRFFISDALRRSGIKIVSADPITRPCRMIKSAAELALLQAANDITMAAYAWVRPRVTTAMTSDDIVALMVEATRALGGEPLFSLVLLNEASAYPHGSHQAQSVREGSTVLMDCGCEVLGYQSDISRTWVHGAPSARQRKVWNTVKRGQEIALETAKPGVQCGRIDAAVRAFYEREGWGPGYGLPGLSHRTGHGIGMDGHEPPYLVSSDTTPLESGMCFSDEPGIYIPGEFGIRLEDCWHMTPRGPRLFSGLARSIDDPI